MIGGGAPGCKKSWPANLLAKPPTFPLFGRFDFDPTDADAAAADDDDESFENGTALRTGGGLEDDRLITRESATFKN